MYLDVEVDGAFRAEIAGGGNEAGAGKFPSEPDRVEARTLPLRGHGAPEMSGHFVTVAHHRARGYGVPGERWAKPAGIDSGKSCRAVYPEPI